MSHFIKQFMNFGGRVEVKVQYKPRAKATAYHFFHKLTNITQSVGICDKEDNINL